MTGWGLIGASTIASQFMINAIRAQEGHDVVSVFSTSAERGEKYAADHGIAQSTTSLGDLLSNPDVAVVYISTTNELHKEQALAAISAGKHVVCEKPLAMNLADAEEMIAAAKTAGVAFATNHHLRNAGTHQAIKHLIDADRIGQLLSIRIFHAVYLPQNLQGWRINNAGAGGGVILDIVVHDADTVRFHTGEDPEVVTAMATASGMSAGVEDSCMTVWRMPSGVMVQAHESFTHKFPGTGIEFHGTEGTIRASDVMTQRPIGRVEVQTEAGVEEVSYSDHDLYTFSMAQFVAAMSGDGRPSADGTDGIKSLAVALAVKEAADTGRAVTVKYGA